MPPVPRQKGLIRPKDRDNDGDYNPFIRPYFLVGSVALRGGLPLKIRGRGTNQLHFSLHRFGGGATWPWVIMMDEHQLRL